MNIVLVEPEIPQNTGPIARTCAATNTPLHLVGKLGFEITEKAVRRAGLDYWPEVRIYQHETFEEYLRQAEPGNIWLFSKFGKRRHYEGEFQFNDSLVFGSETRGLGQEFLTQYPEDTVLRIPMLNENVRSLNLSNAVSIALYEAMRQIGLI